MNPDETKGMKSRLRLNASARNRKTASEYKFSVEFYVFQENGLYIAYCPSFDLSTSAGTYNDVISAFYEAFQLHVECCVENGTLHEDLKAHGWKFHKESIAPPSFSSLMRKPEMKKLMGSDLNFERIVSPARIPCLA